jgi:hypothetical protein
LKATPVLEAAARIASAVTSSMANMPQFSEIFLTLRGIDGSCLGHLVGDRAHRQASIPQALHGPGGLGSIHCRRQHPFRAGGSVTAATAFASLQHADNSVAGFALVKRHAKC